MQFTTINAQIFKNCDSSGNPVYDTQSVSVIQGNEDAETLRFKELSIIQGSLICGTSNSCAAIPESWLLRPESQRSQVIYQFAEIDDTGKVTGSPKYQITVPHHIADKSQAVQLPSYKRGNWEIIYVLNDNSKVTIHSFDEANGITVLNAIKNLIIQSYQSNAYVSKSSLVTTKNQIAQITVACRSAKYYSQGTLTDKPDWIVKWST